MVEALESLPKLNAEQLRQLAQELLAKVAQQSQIIAQRDSDIQYRQAKIDKLTHELATLKRWKFGRSSEQLNGIQISLIEETIEADIAAIELELQELAPAAKVPAQPRQQPKRAALPAGLPRVDIHHEPDSTTCGCGCQLKRIGQDVSEKLDYTPGVFTVEQHIRGKWACAQCQTLIQAPVPPGTYFWPCRCGNSTLYIGTVGGHLRRAIAGTGGCWRWSKTAEIWRW
ncbi:MAG: IS66 family transposase zinc-finger binding domain-containing protein [Rhodoferax sp.]|nr:IS66 family transposase zinc-finger binding domain-containing protein [Rhodoferax sp.]